MKKNAEPARMSPTAGNATLTVTGEQPRRLRDSRVDELIADLPKGPLDLYRNRASFDWKEMKFLMEGEDALEYKVSIRFVFD